MTKDHPFVMVTIIFLGLIFAGIIIGYMSVNIPEEVKRIPDIITPTPSPTPAQHDYSYDLYEGKYSTMYRPVIVFDYTTIPQNASATNVSSYSYLIVGGGGSMVRRD